jgi:hypothetical protein
MRISAETIRSYNNGDSNTIVMGLIQRLLIMGVENVFCNAAANVIIACFIAELAVMIVHSRQRIISEVFDGVGCKAHQRPRILLGRSPVHKPVSYEALRHFHQNHKLSSFCRLHATRHAQRDAQELGTGSCAIVFDPDSCFYFPLSIW